MHDTEACLNSSGGFCSVFLSEVRLEKGKEYWDGDTEDGGYTENVLLVFCCPFCGCHVSICWDSPANEDSEKHLPDPALL